MTDEDGTAVDIGASQVQRPGNIIKVAHQHTVGMNLAQSLADAGQLVACRLTSQFDGLQHDGIQRHRRTVFPDALQHIEIGAECQTALTAQLVLQLTDGGSSMCGTIETYLLAVGIGQFLAQPFGNGGRTVNFQFHQLVFRASQLLPGSNEIARVGP